MPTSTTLNPISAHWFDGQHGAAQPVEVTLHGGNLHFAGRQLPLQHVQWPERTRHGQRLLLLRDAGVLRFPDAAAFDAWAEASGQLPSWVERWQLSWPRALTSLMLVSLLLAVAWRWGLPWASDQIVERIPLSAEQPIGDQAMAYIDKELLRPSQLSPAAQAAWQQRLDQMLATARAAGVMGPQGLTRPLELKFRQTSATLGPNAFALPGGPICITDELIELMKDEPDALLTILAHEIGHVHHRHGLRIGLRAMAVTALASVWLGDYSSLLNGLPIVLATNAYSRDHEREADAYARELARAGGVNPARIAVFFERLREKYGHSAESPLAISFSSHPADSERIAFFTKPEGSPAPKN